jgi:E3 ubiquitin-protein ligase TRIP12
MWIAIDSRHNPATMLARQLKIRLNAAEDTTMPKTVANVIVSIHAIATFQALNDYLRPRITSAMAAEERPRGSPLTTSGSAASRLSGVLAAFAAATGLPAPDFEDPMHGLPSNLANALSASAPSSLAGPSRLREMLDSAASADSGRRRSTRLSARASTSNLPGSSTAQASADTTQEISANPTGDA